MCIYTVDYSSLSPLLHTLLLCVLHTLRYVAKMYIHLGLTLMFTINSQYSLNTHIIYTMQLVYQCSASNCYQSEEQAIPGQWLQLLKASTYRVTVRLAQESTGEEMYDITYYMRAIRADSIVLYILY